MTDEKKPDRGQLRIDEQECKGCGLCIEACPPKVISLSVVPGQRLHGLRHLLYGMSGAGRHHGVAPDECTQG